MKKLIRISLVLIIVVLIISCASGPSLQKYYIDNQTNENFISLDVPASVIKLKDDITPETEEALASLKKMNILAFKKNESNVDEFDKEEKKVKAILKNKNFRELMRIKDKGRNIVLKCEGDNDTVDEVIVFASDKDQGFALVRVLGDNMEPAKIMKLARNISDVDADGFKQLENILKN